MIAEVGAGGRNFIGHVLARPGVMPKGYETPIDFIENGTAEEWEAIMPTVRTRVGYLEDRAKYACVVPANGYETVYLNVKPHFTRVVFSEDPSIEVTEPGRLVRHNPHLYPRKFPGLRGYFFVRKHEIISVAGDFPVKSGEIIMAKSWWHIERYDVIGERWVSSAVFCFKSTAKRALDIKMRTFTSLEYRIRERGTGRSHDCGDHAYQVAATADPDARNSYHVHGGSYGPSVLCQGEIRGAAAILHLQSGSLYLVQGKAIRTYSSHSIR